MTYQFRLENPVNSGTGIRLGLFDSGGSRNSDENLSVGPGSPAVYRNYTGYGAFFNPVTTSTTGHTIRQRDADLANGMLNVGTPWTTFDNSGTALTLENLEIYTGVFIVDRTGTDSVTVSHSISGGAISTNTATWNSPPETSVFTSFDTFAILGLASMGNGLQLESVGIQVIPEPTTYAALAGVLILGLVIARRRMAFRQK